MVITQEIISDILSIAMKGGADYGDVYFESRSSFSAQFEDGHVEKILNGTDSGVSIRLIRDLRTYFGHTNDLTMGGLRSLAEAVGRAADSGETATVTLSRAVPPVDFNIELPPENIPPERKIGLLRDADRIARGQDGRIKQVTLIYRDTNKRVMIGTSDGTLAEDERVYTLALVQVVAAEDGIIQTGYEPVGGFAGFEIFETAPFTEIAEEAAKRAVMMLSARKAPAGRMPVVIGSEAGGTMIHEAIGHGLEADLAGQGLSVYTGKINTCVASEHITVIDDATLPGKRGSFRFDDEGIPAQRTVLVEKGLLVNYLYDRLNAMKFGGRSTGNGRRESYRHRPIPRMSNTFIAPGTHSPDEIIRSVEQGLYVKKMGGGQVNTVNGDFVFDVQEGYLIEKGEISEPVRGATLTGNGPAILQSIDMVGTDLGFAIGTCGKDAQGVPVSDAMPTVRIPEMVVGGALQ
jgi:TldD protein